MDSLLRRSKPYSNSSTNMSRISTCLGFTFAFLFAFSIHLSILQAFATSSLAQASPDTSRHLLSSKPTLTLQLLINGLQRRPLDDQKRQALVRVVADLAVVDAHSVFLESVEYPAPKIIECKTNRYRCSGSNFIDQTTYLAALNETCTHHSEIEMVSCSRWVEYPFKDGALSVQ